MYYEWLQQHKRTIGIVSTALIIVTSIWLTATYVSRIGKVGVTIAAVPSDATVTINDRSVGNGTKWLPAGIYTISAKKDGYASRSKTVTITEKKKQNAVALALTPQSDKAKKWADAHADQYKANEAHGAIEARINGDYFRAKNPVTTVLPYTDPYYEIGYTQTGETSLVITISTTSPRYRYFAVQKFRELGFNPSDFKIEFKDFKNPLGGNDE